MSTITLNRWTIRRSGNGLAITGLDDSGASRTVTGIPQIYPADGGLALPHGAGRTKEDGPVTVLLG